MHEYADIGSALRGLSSTNPIERELATFAIGRLTLTREPYPQRAVDPLSAVLLNDDAARVRRAAAWALARIPDDRAIEPLLRALGDSIASVRRAAAEALGTLKEPTAREPLAALLNDPDSSVRCTAVEAIAAIGSERAREILTAALAHPDPRVSAVAAEALSLVADRGPMSALQPAAC